MRRFFFAFCLIFIFAFTSVAQETAVAPALIAQYGRGEVKSVAWSPDGQSVWVGTSEGTWQLDSALNESRAFPNIRYGALSPDGKWLAGYDSDGLAKIWDAVKGIVSIDFGYSYDYRGYADAPLWSPKSNAVVFPEIENQRPPSLYRIPLDSEEVRYPALHDLRPATYFAWSPSGKTLAGYDPYIQQVWAVDVSTPNSLEYFALPENTSLYDYGSTYLLWRGNDTLTWGSIGDGGDGRSWHLPTLISSEGGCRSYYVCAYSPYGRYYADVDGSGILKVGVTGLQENFQYSPHPLSEHQEPFGSGVSAIAWQPDSATIVASIQNSTHYKVDERLDIRAVTLLNTRTGVPIWIQNTLSFAPRLLLWSPDASKILVENGGLIGILRASDGVLIAQTERYIALGLIDFDSASRRIALADTNGGVSIIALDDTTATPLAHQAGDGYTVQQLTWQPYGNSLIVANGLAAYRPSNWAVRIWDTQSGDITYLDDYLSVRASGNSPIQPMQAAAWSPNGKILAYPDGNAVRFVQHGYPDKMIAPDAFTFFDGYSGTQSIYWPPLANHPMVRTTEKSSHRDVILSMGKRHHSSNTSYRVRGITADGDFVTAQWAHYGDGGGKTYPYPILYTPYGKRGGIELTEMTTGAQGGWVSPLGGYIALIDTTGDGLIWRSDGTPLHFLSDTAEVVWSPDDSLAAIIRRDGSLWLIGVDNTLSRVWSPIVKTGHTESSVVWSGDGTTLAYRYGGVVRVWRL